MLVGLQVCSEVEGNSIFFRNKKLVLPRHSGLVWFRLCECLGLMQGYMSLCWCSVHVHYFSLMTKVPRIYSAFV